MISLSEDLNLITSAKTFIPIKEAFTNLGIKTFSGYHYSNKEFNSVVCPKLLALSPRLTKTKDSQGTQCIKIYSERPFQDFSPQVPHPMLSKPH